MRYLGLFFLLFSLSHSAGASLEQFSTFDETSVAVVDHRPMVQILNLINIKDRKKEKVAYSRLQGRALEYVTAYISYLESVPVSTLNRNEQLAYWLNLHNAAVIHLVASTRNGHKKLKSLRGTPAKPGKEWQNPRLTVEGQQISLQDIEQNILARHWDDPLFIYGLNYNVQGSPTVHGVAFSGKNVIDRLEDNARKFVNSSKNVNVKRKGVEVSSLYEWHKASLFNNDDARVVEHLSRYANPRLGQELNANPKISKHRFNWKSVAYIPRTVPNLDSGGGYRGAGS